MRISDFDYNLPAELIAREPVRPRDASRMMVLDARAGIHADSAFKILPELLRPSDVLVLNDTQVVRSRLYGTLERQAGTSREIEVFFAEPADECTWRVLCRPGRRIRPGDRVSFANGQLTGIFRGTSAHDALHELELGEPESIDAVLNHYGHVPLPPYIARPENANDAVDYQTVFASSPGAVAAPTAGLHFTSDVLQTIAGRGVEILKITLHVGIGTFLPLRGDNPEHHVLRPERFHINAHTADRLRSAQSDGRRIVAVGTTTTRTLEYVKARYSEFQAVTGYADLFILPGFKFQAIDAMVTNFHLPRSTLLMLVAAFAGRDAVLAAYAHAVKQRYRFYSYGDCMFITR